jgi:hypothetical protein
LRGSKVVGDRETTTNLRYKLGRNVQAESRNALIIKDPASYKIPSGTATSTTCVIAKEDHYFVYPTDYNKYLARYKDSFQHGGISLEEMVLPVVTLEPR